MISDLGRGPGALFFNIGVVIAGLVAIPFGFYLGKSLNTEETNDKIVNLVIISYIISCISLCLVGIFPGILDNYLIFFLHGLFAFISFTTAAIYLVLFGYLVLKDDRYTKGLAYLGFTVAVFYIIVVLTWLPIIEWIAEFGIITWTILTASYLLSKKK